MGSPFAMKHRRNPMVMALHSSLAPCEMPSVSSLREQAVKVGRLKKLSGKGILTSGTWRERFCLLVKNKLYYYDTEDSTGTEKSCGFVNLEYFDTCTEASTRMAKKTTNVLVIGSSDKSFFDSHSGRHYFAAETLSEMKDWVNAINSAMNSRIKEKKTTRDGSVTPKQTKRDSTRMKSKTDDSPTGTLPRSGGRLDHVTKGRVRPPQGRRLPTKPQKPNAVDPKTDLVLESDEETAIRDSRGRATSLSALEATSESHSKISNGKDGGRFQVQGSRQDNNTAIESWGRLDQDADGAETPDIELIYDYSSSEESNQDTGSQLNTKRGLISNTYVQRRPISRAGSNIRNSSVTPPPCVLRKNRREQESNNLIVNNMKMSQNGSHQREESLSPLPPEFGTLHRASSGSSLSTLTADTYAQISHPTTPSGVTFLSLRRVKGAKNNGCVSNGCNSSPNHNAQMTPHSMKPPLAYPHRQSSSVNGSPLLSSGHHNNAVMQQHIRRNGFNSHNNSPNGTFDRNSSLMFHGNNEFQFERNLLSMNKDLESITQEVKQLDVDVTGLRQDVGSVQENIVTVRGATDATKEKVVRLQNHVNYIEKQVASIIQEAKTLKGQAQEMMDSAKSAKDLQTNLLDEAQTLVGFLRQSAHYIPPSSYPQPHQHFNSQFGQSGCCSSSPCGTPLPPCCPPLQQQSSPVPTSKRRRGKSLERSLASEEADMNTLKESTTQKSNGYFDSLKSRATKSALSNSSSCSGGSAKITSSNRASIAEPFERKSAGSRSPNCNGKTDPKVSHL